MQNTCLFNAATTLAVDQGKLFVNNRSGSDLTAAEAQRFIPMDITGIFGVTKQAAAAGVQRSIPVTVTGTPVVGVVYKLTIQVFKDSDPNFFGPGLSNFDVQFTAATAVAADVAAGLNTALLAAGPYFGVTSSVVGAVITITSNTVVPQNINVISTGVGAVTFAAGTAFVRPFGLAAPLLASGLTNAVAGQIYTQYVFKVKQGYAAGHVNTGTEYLEQTVYTNNATLVTAIDAFIAAPLASPAPYNL
jgi:hypothetical protein